MSRILSAFKQKQFKDLQAHWYEILKNEGFQEIEDTNSPREFLKCWHHSYFIIKTKNARNFKSNTEYYYKAAQFLETYNFQSFYEKEVWRLHAEGKSVRAIAAYLKNHGIRTNKDYVANIIRCLKTLLDL